MAGPEGLNISKIADSTLRVGGLAFDLARIDRATTLGPDGVLESDTDHSISVTLIAMELGQYDPRLNLGRVAILSAVHDIAETRSVDVQTFYLDDALRSVKAAADKQGREGLDAEFGESSPWLLEGVDEYEAGETLEAGHVQIADKISRAIAHLNDGGRSLLARGMTVAEHDRNVAKTYEHMAKQMERHPIAAAVWVELDGRVRDLLVAAQQD